MTIIMITIAPKRYICQRFMRNKNNFNLLSFLVIALLVLSSCNKNNETETDEEPIDVNLVIPAGWPQPVYNNTANTITEAGFKLGRKLFFDPLLSKDNSTSCGSCHQQFAAFANLDHAVSHGIDNLIGTRNAPPIYNLIWHDAFMWDGGINNLEVMPLAPITNPIEMNETIENVILKLKASSNYRQMFKSAFGSDTINSQRMLLAFTQFMALMVSSNSKYDKVKNGQASFTANESAGYTLFIQKCASCHKEPLMSDFTYRNNGLDSIFTDLGRGHITNDVADNGKFKVPSLRNVELSRPYMHDGRFKTLDQCVEHYISGIKQSATLDSSLTTGVPLTGQNKLDIISFLKTLTDNSFINDSRFSEVN